MKNITNPVLILLEQCREMYGSQDIDEDSFLQAAFVLEDSGEGDSDL